MIIVVLLLSVIGGMSIQFSDRSARFNTMAASDFSRFESRFFAEAALNNVYSQFFHGVDLNNDGQADNGQVGFDVSTKLPTLSYLYYVSSDGGKIDQTAPSLLQKVADGEAINAAGVSLTTQAVSFRRNKLKISDLTSAMFSPRIYVMNNAGQLVLSKLSFASENRSQKAAVWIEIIADASDSSLLNLYVQVVGQSGTYQTYLQRYVGSVTVGSPSVLGRSIASLTQNS